MLYSSKHVHSEGATPAPAGHTRNGMMKVEGYGPDAGAWFWPKFDPTTGDAEVAGTGDCCSSCPGAAAQDGDWFLVDEENQLDQPDSRRLRQGAAWVDTRAQE